MNIKRMIGKMIRYVLPWRFYKLLANGFIIVPKYYKSIINDTESYFDLSLEDNPKRDIMLMRKMGHIIDKGLHREDAEPGHSKACYVELKHLIEKLSQSEYKEDPTYRWAKEKLCKYESLQLHPDKFKPLRQEMVPSSITFDQLFDVIKSRRSNRCFKQENVSYEIITKLKETVNWAPNSCNKQPIKLFVTNDSFTSKACLKCCAGGTGFSEDIPSFWCFTANVRGYVWPSELYLPAIDTSLGAENLFLAAYTLGLSGTILSWGQKTEIEERKMRSLLHVPSDYCIIFCAVIGYPQYGSLPPVRKTNQ